MNINSLKNRPIHKVIFTISSSSNGRYFSNIESDRIAESELEEWAKDAFRHHIGRQMTNNEWEIFNTNGSIVRKVGHLIYEFNFDRYTIE